MWCGVGMGMGRNEGMGMKERTGRKGEDRDARMRTCTTPTTTYQMGVLVGLHGLHVVELDVEELIDGEERSLELEVVLEFDDDGLAHQRLEERVEQLA